MDNLTHSLVGYFLSRAGLNRLTPHATPILLLAANAPDIDVVAALGGQAALLRWHRDFTHSLLFAPLLAFAAVALVNAVARKNRPFTEGLWGGFLAALIGVGSHLLLDLTNNYGIRLLAPFSGHWFAWDTVFVADPYIWAILLLAAAFPLLSKLLQSEMGPRKKPYPGRAAAWFALTGLLLWEGGRATLHARAVATLASRDYAGATPRRVAAFPTPLSPFRWQALVETSDRYLLYRLDLNQLFDPDLAEIFSKQDPDGAVSRLRESRSFDALIGFTEYPLWAVTPRTGGGVYKLTDLRFGNPATGTFTCSAELAGSGPPTDTRCNFTFSPRF